MHYLIVDDDDICRHFLARALAKYGTSEIAKDGREAIELFAKSLSTGQLYDIIFLDIMMPIMDGRLALTSIRHIEMKAGLLPGWGTKIVMTTALGNYESIQSAFKGQCDGYLVKPLKMSRLLALLHNLNVIPRSASSAERRASLKRLTAAESDADQGQSSGDAR